jgi:hypothetical protein
MGGTVAIVGCGLVGRAWAIVFARAGYETRLWDERPEAADAARAFAGTMLPELESLGLIDCRAEEALSRIRVTGTLAEALDGAAYVQESTFEDLAVKREVFARLDALAGPTRSWPRPPRRSCPRPSPRVCRAATDASSPIRSTPPISSRRWNWCRRPGPTRA